MGIAMCIASMGMFVGIVDIGVATVSNCFYK